MNSKSLVKDIWLSNNLGLNSYYINGYLKPLPSSVQFCYSKTKTDDIDSISKLISFGFNLIETNIQLSIESSRLKFNHHDCRFALPKDKECVKKIAYESFQHSRFFKDPMISNKKASLLKSSWAENYFNGGRGDWMIVLEISNKVVGFLQLIKGKEGSLVIDLIAVKNDFQGRGLAKNMIYYAVEKCLTKSTLIKVGTQLSNIESLKFYNTLGFNINSSYFISHYHIPRNENK